uniref:Uncharacterized protein n=1 Tax=Arundo donax TaxID=35708 RepID=A0A0A9E5G6_ARUDO
MLTDLLTNGNCFGTIQSSLVLTYVWYKDRLLSSYIQLSTYHYTSTIVR